MGDTAPEHQFTLDQLRSGDEPAWEKAFKCLYGLAFNVLKRNVVSLNEADLQEAAQDAVIEIIEKYVAKVPSVEDLKRLVITIAKRKALDQIRKQQAEKRGKNVTVRIGDINLEEDDEKEEKYFKSTTPTPEEVADQVERAYLMEIALQQIKTKYADVLRDSFFLGLPHKEIAAKRGLKIGTIGVYITRGMEELAPLLRSSNLL